MTTRSAAADGAAASDLTSPARLAPLAGLRRTALLLPGVVWLAVFCLLPLAFIFIVSLGTRDELHRIVLENPSLDNYRRAFNPIFLPTVVTSVYYAAATTILSLAIAFPLAYWISRYGGRHKVILLLLVMLPFWASYLIRTYAWIIILRDQGVANAMLQAVGLTNEPIVLLNTDFSVILGMTYGFRPFAISRRTCRSTGWTRVSWRRLGICTRRGARRSST